MVKMYDSLMKSGKFTAAQNKAENGEFLDSISEFVVLCEKDGFIPRVLITPASTFECSSRSGHLTERLEEIREECGRLPYDSILIDNNYIMFLI